MRSRLRVLLTVVAALLCLPLALLAQGERGAITGVVTDQTGAAIPRVEVVVTELQTGVQTKSVATDAGLYRIPYLPPGDYRISASAPGFKTAVIEHVDVTVAGVVTANLKFEVGDVNQ